VHCVKGGWCKGWGVVFDLEGKHETSYALGIGKASNNQAKALAFWIGVWIMKN
jgi:ribonuclease HI